MNLNKVIDMDKSFYMNTFGDRIPVSFSHGKGISLYSSEGKEYYDFFAGIAVSALGHSHPTLVTALKRQVKKLLHTSSLYYIENQALLAKEIVNRSCADKVFFANSGAEANEGAIKLAKIYNYKKGSPKTEIISLVNSFHGRTLATVGATGQEKYQKPYKPLHGFKHVLINDLAAFKKAASKNTAAIILEPIQGEGGVHCLEKQYLKNVYDFCKENDILLIFDEVQTGIGRTGKMFAYEHFGVEPDIFTLAKALGGGVPIGALCAKDFVAEAFEIGDHGTTFGGNPLSTAAGLAVFRAIDEENLVENAEKMGAYLKENLEDLGCFEDVRGIGLMIGADVSYGAKDIVNKMFEEGFLIGCVGDKTLRVLPPLIVTKENIDKFVSALNETMKGN